MTPSLFSSLRPQGLGRLSCLFLLLGLGVLLSAPANAAWTAKGDFSTCPRKYIPETQGTGGTYQDRSECEAEIAKVAASQSLSCAHYYCQEGGGGGASSTSSDTSLNDATSRALAEGLVHGDSQTFGMGLMGLGVMALTSGSSGPSAADLEAQRRAQEAQRQQLLEAQRAEAARKKKFEEDKDEALGDLKDNGAEAAVQADDPFDLKDGELKDGPNDPVPPKKKKPFPHLHLKPVDDPLHKTPLAGDAVPIQHHFNTWEEAKGFDGLTALDNSSGKIVGCPKGFPYVCSGQCYREAALNDFRIPCDSTLRTSLNGPAQQGPDDLK